MNNTIPKIAFLTASILMGHVKMQTHSNKTECYFAGNFVKYIHSFCMDFSQWQILPC